MTSQVPALRLVTPELKFPSFPVVVANTDECSRDEWLALRKLGASDAAAVCGLNRYRSPYSVWLEKTERAPAQAETEAMELGSLLEPMVATLFERRTGMKVIPCPFLYAHPEHDWMTASPDYLVQIPTGELALLEIKTTGEHNASEWADGIPDHAHLQVMHQLAVTGLQTAYVAVLVGGNKFAWHEVVPDETVIEQLIAIESDFWALVESGTPPEIGPNDKGALEQQYPTGNVREEVVELPADAISFIEEYDAAKADIDAAERRRDTASNCLRAMLGCSSEGRIDDRRVVWKTEHRKSYTVPASTFRKFAIRTIKAPKGAK